MFMKRPHSKEGEEEVLAEQARFVSSSSADGSFIPAAKAVRISRGINDQTQKGTGGPEVSGSGKEEIEGEEDEIPAILEEPVEAVLQANVLEKAFDPSKLMNFSTGPSKVFPIPGGSGTGKSLFARAKEGNGGEGREVKGPRKGKSLFAQVYDEQLKMTDGDSGGGDSSSSQKTIPVGDQIHPYLAGMTEEEILEEQRKLIERLDPKLVEFVRSRRNKNQVDKEGDSSTGQGQGQGEVTQTSKREEDVVMKDAGLPEEGDTFKSNVSFEDTAEVSDLPIDPQTVRGIPHMDNVELDKLQWTGVVKENRTKFDKLEEGKSARFNFEGMLINEEDVDTDRISTFEKGLHHHGEEMERPGYTVEELLILSRSTNNKQKAAALKILGNIYAKAHTGMYDLILGDSLFALWEHMDFIFTIRKALDEGDKTLINEAIHCLANILYPWEEEACLDFVYSWEFSKPHPWISTKSENLSATLDPGEEEKEMRDDEMLRMDVLEFFIHRSNLLDRLAYFLGGDSLTPMGVVGILKILIRVARHSPETLIKHELLAMVVQNYTGPNWNATEVASMQLRGVPMWMAFKVLRILVDSSQGNAMKVYYDFNILPAIMAYLAYDDWKSVPVIQKPELLVIESFRIWTSMISQGIAIDEYKNFFPVLMKFLMLYGSMDRFVTFDCIHSGYVFSLLLAVLTMQDEASGLKVEDKHSHWVLVKDCISFTERTIVKLLTIMISPHLTPEYDEGVVFWTISRGLLLLSESMKYTSSISSSLEPTILKLFSSSCYSDVTSKLIANSVILRDSEIKEKKSRYPANFSSVNAIEFGGDCNPILGFSTRWQFLSSLIHFRNTLGNSIPLKTVLNSNIEDYVKLILQPNRSRHSPNFFIRYELGLLLRILQSYPSDSAESFYLAYEALSASPRCCSHLFNEVFSIAISASCDERDLETCYKIYGGYLLVGEGFDQKEVEEETTENCDIPKKKVKFSADTKAADGSNKINMLRFGKWNELAIDSHWILEPLHRIRTIISTIPDFLSKRLSEVELQCRICLQVIDKCLQRHKDFVIQTRKDFVDTYYAVCQIFLLGDPGIYLHKEIQASLSSILKSLLSCSGLQKWKNKPVFSVYRQKTGRPNMFYDFYPELIREFSENSYFNQLFLNYLLIPLRTQEDGRLRSNFWIMQTLGFFKARPSEMLVPIEYLTVGIEMDESLRHIYNKLIRTKRISRKDNEFLFEVLERLLHPTASDEKTTKELAQLKI